MRQKKFGYSQIVLLLLFLIVSASLVIGTPIAKEIRATEYNDFPYLAMRVIIEPFFFFLLGYVFLWLIFLYVNEDISIKQSKKTILKIMSAVLFIFYLSSGIFYLVTLTGRIPSFHIPYWMTLLASENSYVLMLTGVLYFFSQSKGV